MDADGRDDREARRLAALDRCRILDTPPDPRFDAMARLAAEICDVPVALVSFVDARRQWFKAAVGLGLCETSRDSAFCAVAIQQPHEVMVIEDATLDPRFADSSLVATEPRIRFYAGAPICIEDGQALGTLCIMDVKPRTLDETGRRRLAELAGSVSCILELHRSAAQLGRLDTHDVLTGTVSRRAFEDRFEEAVAGALAGRPCGLLVIDLDGLKTVNESLGHAAGDLLLREVAARLKAAVRTGDLVGRLGGDEFAILMPGPVGAEAACALGARIVNDMHRPVVLAGRELTASASVGIALCPVDATDPSALMRHALESLHRAKRGGRGRFARLGGDGSEITASHQSLGEELRIALAADELSLVWQPYFQTMSGRVAGYEALARWDRRAAGPIGPAVFVPVVEASGLSGRFDAWVLETACRAAAQWPESLSVAINISAHWFSDGEAVELVEATLRRCGLAPERLVLEMTERTLVTHSHAARAQMERLHALGVRIALDDFGVGFSSLAIVRDFPFDELKLDRAFVKDLVIDPRADAVARAVLQLGRALGMAVCAEGVETEAQLAFLRAEQCDIVQGYLLGRPAPAANASALRTNHPVQPPHLALVS
jgi:diguanylate cyclase (GGDEF)-like protein